MNIRFLFLIGVILLSGCRHAERPPKDVIQPARFAAILADMLQAKEMAEKGFYNP